MPELPEVETMRRGILSTVGGTIVAAEKLACVCRSIDFSPSPAKFRQRVTGQSIVAVDRRGKRVLVLLDSKDTIVFEPRMTGLVLIADPPNIKHLRVRLELTGCAPKQLLYWDRRGLGNVRLLSPTQVEQQLGGDALGPDALLVTVDQLYSRLRKSRRAIKVALLDQKVLAGVGNLYASEMLFLARVSPRAVCCQLSKRQWERVHEAMNTVLRDAIRYEGSTLGDGTYRNALNKAGSYQNHHRVYDRAGVVCSECKKSVIRRIVQAQRSTFYCPTCQSSK